MDKSEIALILSNTPTFNKLSPADIEEFIGLSELKEYKNGEIVYREGAPGDYFYFLLKGRILALTTAAGRESEIDLLKRGTSFGIISIFTDEPHSVTTRSIESSYILCIPKNTFKDFINTHPPISLDFSRMLSQRVRAKTALVPKRIFQVKRIGVVGFPSAGKTTYLYNLGRQLAEETNKKVICIEVSSSDNFILPYLGKFEASPLALNEFQEENAERFIATGLVDCLLLKVLSPGNFSGLINSLSERYHFILYEIPFSFWDGYSDDFITLADHIHFLLFPQIEELRRAGILLEAFKAKNPLNREKCKIIINEFGSKDTLSYAEKHNLLGQTIYATLPAADIAGYPKALRRVARHTAEVVTGLALGSGAAFGFAHIGVLSVLEESDITIDVICGSSMGSVVAAVWALGFDTEEIIARAREFSRRIGAFSGFSFPFMGLVRSHRLQSICKRIFGTKTFYDLRHALKIVAFDFAKKEIIVLEEGFLYTAVAASCAMPGIFEPVRLKEDILLDGGILNPLPTKILLNYGVNRIIAVDIMPTQEEIRQEYKRRNKLHIFDFIFGSIETMQRQFVQQAISIADVVVHPRFEGLGWMEFEKAAEFIARGERAAREKVEDIKRLT